MDDVKNDVKNKTYNKKASEQNARKPWNFWCRRPDSNRHVGNYA